MDRIALADKKNRLANEASSKAMRVALLLDWPCGHERSELNTHAIGDAVQCRFCRRQRWNAGFRRIAKRKQLARSARKEKEKARQEYRIHRQMIAQQSMEDRVNAAASKRLAGRLSAPSLFNLAASFFDVSRDDLYSSKRAAPIVKARAVIFRVLRDRGHSTTVIGQLLGGKDHSTVIHSLKNWDKYCEQDPRVLIAYEYAKDEV